MSGISKIYVIGEPGGFMGADGVNPIYLMILVGDGNRQWLEPSYVDWKLGPMGTLKSLVPEEPDHPDALLDACLAFAPDLFSDCPSLEEVSRSLSGVDQLDFHLKKEGVPTGWSTLREEARPFFSKLNIWTAKLRPLGSE